MSQENRFELVGGPAARLVTLRLTWAPSGAVWEPCLGSNPGDRRALIGWTLATLPIDSGVPEPVAGLLAAALCRAGGVAFLDQRHGAAAPGDWTADPSSGAWHRTLAPPGRLAQWFGRWFGRPPLPLTFTGRAECARRLFDADGFSWCLRGQRCLLLPAGAPPPPLRYRPMMDLLSQGFLAPAELARLRIAALLAPGIDGDFAELVVVDHAYGRALEDALAEACRERGVGWAVLPEAEFQAMPLGLAAPAAPHQHD